jgi:transcriptional regulator with XRE-family HTH domain
MNETHVPEPGDLASKIARLVEEKGWNQEEFARMTRLNRHTVRQILIPSGDRRLRNATVSACARALGLTVHDLRNLPLPRLLARMHQPAAIANGENQLSQLYNQATLPELRAWIERNPTRAQMLLPEEIEELLSLQEPTGPLATFGVEGFMQTIERRRKLIDQVTAIAGTEYQSLLEQFVQLLYDKAYPSRPTNGGREG